MRLGLCDCARLRCRWPRVCLHRNLGFRTYLLALLNARLGALRRSQIGHWLGSGLQCSLRLRRGTGVGTRNRRRRWLGVAREIRLSARCGGEPGPWLDLGGAGRFRSQRSGLQILSLEGLLRARLSERLLRRRPGRCLEWRRCLCGGSRFFGRLRCAGLLRRGCMLLCGLGRQLDGQYLGLGLRRSQTRQKRDRQRMHENRNGERPPRGSVAMPRLRQWIEKHYPVCTDGGGHGCYAKTTAIWRVSFAKLMKIMSRIC